jgi:hypothetical protein
VHRSFYNITAKHDKLRYRNTHLVGSIARTLSASHIASKNAAPCWENRKAAKDDALILPYLLIALA